MFLKFENNTLKNRINLNVNEQIDNNSISKDRSKFTDEIENFKLNDFVIKCGKIAKHLLDLDNRDCLVQMKNLEDLKFMFENLKTHFN